MSHGFLWETQENKGRKAKGRVKKIPIVLPLSPLLMPSQGGSKYRLLANNLKMEIFRIRKGFLICCVKSLKFSSLITFVSLDNFVSRILSYYKGDQTNNETNYGGEKLCNFTEHKFIYYTQGKFISMSYGIV